MQQNRRIFCAISCLLISLTGCATHVNPPANTTADVPDYGSYKEVDLKAMSTFDMDQQTATLDDIPLPFRQLDGKRCMMVGEMWDPRTAGGDNLVYFQFVYSKTKCCFNGPPLAQNFVDGNVVQGAKVYYYDVPVKVWGTIHVSIHKDQTGTIKSIYHVDVDKVEPIEG